jgi:hypothetical protein
MKIRQDAAFLSSLLFTIAFVWAARWAWWGFVPVTVHPNNADLREVFLLDSEMAILSLAIILIGLIVVWTGYLKKLRWSWFLMFVIVFGCAPILIFRDAAMFPRNFAQPVSVWLRVFAEGIRGEPYISRAIVEAILHFLLMVVALFLPVKAFFFSQRSATNTRQQP